MLVQQWILPPISEVISLSEAQTKCHLLNTGHLLPIENKLHPQQAGSGQKLPASTLFIQAQAKWRSAITALEQLLLAVMPSGSQGLIFTGPVPVLSNLVLSMPTWIFRAEQLNFKVGRQLPPAVSTVAVGSTVNGSIVTLVPADPLNSEQFCLILTTKFSLVMALGKNLTGDPAFLFSFEPEVVAQAWKILQDRIALNSPQLIDQLDILVEQYYPVEPSYRVVMEFSRLLLENLPAIEAVPHQSELECGTEQGDLRFEDFSNQTVKMHDVELIQAFAHEVRTPLTTIRTLTRLLLKRRDLATDVGNRLKIIDRECTEQIERMELIFKAAEMELTVNQPASTQLTAISLSQVLQQSIPRWQSSATRRNLTLDVALPQQLPTVVSDPTMLDRVLTSLIEKFTRSLPPGSHIQIQVIPAGDQLKLQLLPQSEVGNTVVEQLSVPSIAKSIGSLLTFQPETGSISLNLSATKHLFQAIGGKLIVRQRPDQGEVLTIFLPLQAKSAKRAPFKGKGEGGRENEQLI